MKKIMLLILSSLMLLFCGKIDEVSNKDSGNKNSGTNETYKIGITQIFFLVKFHLGCGIRH